MTGASLAEDRTAPTVPRPAALHPTWLSFIRLCRELGHGEIERLVIQDGLPVLAELTRKKVKFP